MFLAGIFALITILGMLPPTSALPKESRNVESSAGSSTMKGPKINQTIPTGTQATNAVTSSTLPVAVFWLRAEPKTWNSILNTPPLHAPRPHHDSYTMRDPHPVGPRSPTCVGPDCTPQIDGQGPSAPPDRNGQNELDGRDERDARVGRDSRDGRDDPAYAKRHEHRTNLVKPFTIQDGKLYQDGGQISTTGDVAYQVFRPSAHVSSIETGFSINGSLAWENEGLSKGKVSFCRMHKILQKKVIYIIFTAKPSAQCLDIDLVPREHREES